MSRKRNQNYSGTHLSPELQGAFMETPGSTCRPDGDFLNLESDEELLCSVSSVSEHLGRNISAALDAAMAEIRHILGIRIRALKMELRDKTDEIALLKAKLSNVNRDAKEAVEAPPDATEAPDAAEVSDAAAFRSSKMISVDPKREKKSLLPGVKKENIDAICNYLMKDKNSRGATEMDGGDQSSQDEDQHPLQLWPDGGMSVSGPPGHTDDIFNMLPSSSRRVYDYEWIAPMEYSSDLKVGKQPECDNEEEDEGSAEQASSRFPHVQPAGFSAVPGSPGEGGTHPLPEASSSPTTPSSALCAEPSAPIRHSWRNMLNSSTRTLLALKLCKARRPPRETKDRQWTTGKEDLSKRRSHSRAGTSATTVVVILTTWATYGSTSASTPGKSPLCARTAGSASATPPASRATGWCTPVTRAPSRASSVAKASPSFLASRDTSGCTPERAHTRARSAAGASRSWATCTHTRGFTAAPRRTAVNSADAASATWALIRVTGAHHHSDLSRQTASELTLRQVRLQTTDNWRYPGGLLTQYGHVF
ncbi:zinc finger protein 16-like isoform X1 [Syngnathus scovelli]|uniref:zinc finger protein 16-like isoform X1 n=1 Tax=Syngnathus scovelli TaxID=161590 RepID=UPI00210FEE10|nr:zinc finger protein 16-like isoform X1 [Syngnathus scovelli]